MPQNYESPNEMTGARLVPYNQRWHYAKIIIRAVNFCLCALSYGLSFLSSAYSIALGPVVMADAAWILLEFVTLAIRRAKKRGIHPVPHLVLDTLFPIAYFYVTIMYGNQVNHGSWRHRNYLAEVFVIIFVVALLILHSVLFVRSCIEVHQRRISRGTPKNLYYIPGEGAPFVVHREPPEAEMNAMPAAAYSSASVSSFPQKEEPKAAGSHGQLGTGRV